MSYTLPKEIHDYAIENNMMILMNAKGEFKLKVRDAATNTPFYICPKKTLDIKQEGKGNPTFFLPLNNIRTLEKANVDLNGLIKFFEIG